MNNELQTMVSKIFKTFSLDFPDMENIDCVYYINLEHRTMKNDRYDDDDGDDGDGNGGGW